MQTETNELCCSPCSETSSTQDTKHFKHEKRPSCGLGFVCFELTLKDQTKNTKDQISLSLKCKSETKNTEITELNKLSAVFAFTCKNSSSSRNQWSNIQTGSPFSDSLPFFPIMRDQCFVQSLMPDTDMSTAQHTYTGRLQGILDTHPRKQCIKHKILWNILHRRSCTDSSSCHTERKLYRMNTASWSWYQIKAVQPSEADGGQK